MNFIQSRRQKGLRIIILCSVLLAGILACSSTSQDCSGALVNVGSCNNNTNNNGSNHIKDSNITPVAFLAPDTH